MSVTFNSKSGMITGDGWELMDSKSEYGGGFRKSVRCIGGVALCLGLLYLLLLVIIIAMLGQYIGPSPLKNTQQPSIGLTTCPNLTSECFQLQGKYSTLLESNNQLETKLCSLTKEKDTVKGERDRLQNERDILQNQRDVLENERNSLHGERDALKIEQGTYKTDLETLQNEQEIIKNERDALEIEQRVLKKEEEKLKSERDLLKNEKETVQHERDTLQIEHGILKSERDTLKYDKSTLQKEQEALKRERDALKNEKDTLQIERDGLRTERDNLTVERDQLSLVSSNLTKELEELQIRFSKVAASRDGLKEEAQELNRNRSVKLCPTKWVKFKEKCYYISEKGETKSWTLSRRDCQDRGGDLVIVTSKAEEDFISVYYDRVWIGLSDLDHEGEWKWVNGNKLDFEGFWQKGEPNDKSSAENCVEHSRSGRGWNDMRCRERLSWICED
ncbi:low affinity immunoglobulin epsilon Fc receptor-like [Hippocampus comes]|uniref:Low affinity immunoglobulin epsilon Fc receptor-like n=1 Tax=Hippocampus comes TaxID=109280 RepID=A0A3Q3DX95_HIPCM|nr:PREDICTED: low affinity immunoglobulin epsilon Fc receptor-like [Hippocampus comes]